jgi:hypothetical protein
VLVAGVVGQQQRTMTMPKAIDALPVIGDARFWKAGRFTSEGRALSL